MKCNLHFNLDFQIIRQFDFAKEWLALVNYDNNFMLRMLKRCHNETEILILTGLKFGYQPGE